MNKEKSSPVTQTASFYEKLLDQSMQMEEVVDRYSSILATTVLALEFNEFNAKTFKIKEMKQVKDKLTQTMSNMKEHIKNQVNLLSTLTQSITYVTQQFKKAINLVKIENQRVDLIILQLDNQIKANEFEIAKYRNNLQTIDRQIQIQKWKNQHYVHQDYSAINKGNTAKYYVDMLQGLQNKLRTKLNFEMNEISIFNINACNKLIDFKEILSLIWSILPTNNDNITNLQIRSPENGHTIPYPISSNNRRDLSDEEQSQQSRNNLQNVKINRKIQWP